MLNRFALGNCCNCNHAGGGGLPAGCCSSRSTPFPATLYASVTHSLLEEFTGHPNPLLGTWTRTANGSAEMALSGGPYLDGFAYFSTAPAAAGTWTYETSFGDHNEIDGYLSASVQCTCSPFTGLCLRYATVGSLFLHGSGSFASWPNVSISPDAVLGNYVIYNCRPLHGLFTYSMPRTESLTQQYHFATAAFSVEFME